MENETLSLLIKFPLLVFFVTLITLWVTVHLGAFFARKVRPVQENERDDLGTVVNASLTMLALIIGFTFSMAVSRYDQRKNYEEEEANAIGTEYVRVDLLASADEFIGHDRVKIMHRVGLHRGRLLPGEP